MNRLRDTSNYYMDLCFKKDNLKAIRASLQKENKSSLEVDLEYNFIKEIIANCGNINESDLFNVIAYLVSVVENREYQYVGNYKVVDSDNNALDIRLLPYVIQFTNLLPDFNAYKSYEYSYPSSMGLTYEELYNLANQFLDEEVNLTK